MTQDTTKPKAPYYSLSALKYLTQGIDSAMYPNLSVRSGWVGGGGGYR